MGDATVEDRGNSGRMTIQNTNREFLEYIDDQLGIFSLGIKSYYTAEEHGDRVSNIADDDVSDNSNFKQPFEIKTRAHPYFKELYSWYETGKKQFPESLDFNPTVAKMWYCCDGSLITSDSQRPHARFYTKNERGRLDILVQYFRDHGLDARKYEGAVGFTADETEQLLDWMGEPPDGMKYKWITDGNT